MEQLYVHVSVVSRMLFVFVSPPVSVGPVVHFASVTTTLLSGTSPVFVTVNVNVAVPSTRTCCDAGVLTMWIPGAMTVKHSFTAESNDDR